jgi:hypothetical protein
MIDEGSIAPAAAWWLPLFRLLELDPEPPPPPPAPPEPEPMLIGKDRPSMSGVDGLDG